MTWKHDLDNNDRAEMAQTAISAFADAYYGKMRDGQPSEEDETILGDLVADIRHYCDAKGFDFHAIVDSSYQTYLEEVSEDGGPATRVGDEPDPFPGKSAIVHQAAAHLPVIDVPLSSPDNEDFE